MIDPDESMVDLGGGMVVPLSELINDESPLPESCEECDGEGFVECDDPDCSLDDHVCPDCNGFGR